MLNKNTRDRLRRLNSFRNRKAADLANQAREESAPTEDANLNVDREQADSPDANESKLPNQTNAILRARLSAAQQAHQSLGTTGRKPKLPLRAGSKSRPATVLPTEHGALAGGVEVVNASGKHLLVERSMSSLWSPDAQIAAWSRLNPIPEPKPIPPKKKVAKAQLERYRSYEAFRNSFPKHCVFLDLETCGLAGASIFLTGILHFDGGEWQLSQFWARNYAEESSMLASVKECLADRTVLVTFNGKSFDWPQVRDRCTLHARSTDCGLPELVHVDLLHLARHRWKHILPDCKLQTLERFICGRHRLDDIPGRDIPAAYDEYVRSGQTNLMDHVLHHNALDLITLMELALRWDERSSATGMRTRSA